MHKQVKVVLVDGQQLVRSGLSALLSQSDDIEVVALADGEEEMVRYTRGHRPDVLVIDPGTTAPDEEMLLTIKQISPQTEVVALFASSNLRQIRQTMQVGVKSVVLKEEPPVALVAAIRDSARGRGYINPRVGVALARDDDSSELSGREEEVLRLIAHGFTNHEISKQMYLSIRTIEAHRSNIQKKIDANSRHAMVAHAVESGIFP